MAFPPHLCADRHEFTNYRFRRVGAGRNLRANVFNSESSSHNTDAFFV